MSKLLKTTLMGAATAVAIGAFAASASADPITFTWNPGSLAAGAGTVTANNIIISDFANATIDNFTGNFAEDGVLLVTQYQNNGIPVGPADNQLGNSYNLYFTFHAQGSGSFSGPGSYNGTIDSLSYSFVIDPGAGDTITNTGSPFGTHTLVDGGTGDIVLATGTETNGPTANQVNINAGIPGASSTATFLPSPAAIAANFFVSPSAAAYLALVIEDSFINTAGQETVTPSLETTSIDIHGGGGNADFTVPEPASLSIFGAGLLAFGFLKRRRNKQA